MNPYRTLRGLGFRRLDDGSWVRPLSNDNRQFWSKYSMMVTDPWVFYKQWGGRPLLVASVSADGIRLSQYERGGRYSTLLTNAWPEQVVQVVCRILREHRVRGNLGKWWHQNA